MFVVSRLLSLCLVIFVPATLLILGAGYSFSVVLGPVQGSIAALLASLLGSLLGALLSFYRSRYMMRDVIEVFSKRYPIVQAADVGEYCVSMARSLFWTKDS